jgi:hypothetical protein
LHLAASFQAPRLLRFIRKEVLQGCEQERPEFASLLIYARQRFVLKEIKEKALGQVLCVMRRKPITPDMAVKGVPIELTKLGQRVFRARHLALRGKEHNAPSSSAELVRPADRRAMVQLHAKVP